MEKFKKWFFLKEENLLSSYVLILMYGLALLSLSVLIFIFILDPSLLSAGFIFRTLLSILILALISVGVRKIEL